MIHSYPQNAVLSPAQRIEKAKDDIRAFERNHGTVEQLREARQRLQMLISRKMA